MIVMLYSLKHGKPLQLKVKWRLKFLSKIKIEKKMENFKHLI